MYTMNHIELSKQHREEVAQQVENNRLARQLKAARTGMATGTAALGRFFAWSPRKEQAVEC